MTELTWGTVGRVAWTRTKRFLPNWILRRTYQSACFIMSDREAGIQGKYTEPAEDLCFEGFVALLVGKLLVRKGRLIEHVKAKQLRPILLYENADEK